MRSCRIDDVQQIIKISQQTFWQLLGKAITSLSTIIILSVVARSFGASEVGVLTLALTYLSFFALFADFGLNAHVLPQLIQGSTDINWQKLFGMRLLLASIATVFAFLIIWFWPGQGRNFQITVLLGLVSIAQAAVVTTATALFQSRLRYDLAVLANILGTAVTLGLVLILIGQRAPVFYLILGYVGGWIVTALLALIFIKKINQTLMPIINLSYIKDVLKAAWPISATLVLNMVYFRVDAFILSFSRTFVDVGVYNLAYSIFQSLLVIPTFIMNSYYPLMLQRFAQGKEFLFRDLKKASLAMLALALIGIVLTVLLAPWVVGIISGGKGFSGSVTSLQILSFGFPAFFLSSVLMWTLITLKRYRLMLAIYLGGLLFNSVLNLIFIPKYSYLAASWVTVISEYLILVLQMSILGRYFFTKAK